MKRARDDLKKDKSMNISAEKINLFLASSVINPSKRANSPKAYIKRSDFIHSTAEAD